jgi:hypothetical protein
MKSIPKMALSTDPKLICGSKTCSAANGNWPPSSLISKCPNGLNWNTWIPTARPKKLRLSFTGAARIFRKIFGNSYRTIRRRVSPLGLPLCRFQILPISDKQNKYSQKIVDELERTMASAWNFDDRSESVGRKIREAEMNKVPYMLIIGEKEARDDVISVRVRNQKDLGAMKLEKFLDKVKKEIQTRSL